ncbi:MAG TPA: trypsin-like peptidase domain-containing protein [Gemmatimonadaceae bacterium]|nr:trypsin-like peptidase domain-containing protein [Gemmatimonadaceae bacterium]
MSSLSSRARVGLAVFVAFLGGLIVASGGLDLSRLGFAQSKPSPTTVATLAEASNAFVSIADHVTPAVVSISVESRPTAAGTQRRRLPQGMTVPPGMEEFFNQFGDVPPQVENGSGSGFIVSKDGYILTNNHVVTMSDRTTIADRVTVQMLDNRTYKARVVGNDPTTDVALIKIDGSSFPTLPLGNDATSRVGEWVLAIGNPLGFDFTVTAGIISAKGRSLPGLLNRRGSSNNYSISDLIQTDAAINPGNSGGPLVNSRGEVIGITSAIASPTGMNAGYGFAIPISLAKKVMDDIIKHGRVRVGVLGIQIREVTPEDAAVAGMNDIRGAKVDGFNPATGSGAERAGMQAGDIIITADGQPVDRVSTLQRIVRNHAPGETVELEVMRYGKKQTVKVKLTELAESPRVAATGERGSIGANPAGAPRPAGIMNPALGATLQTVPPELATRANLAANRRGVLVTDVVPLGPAYNKLIEQDVIFEVLYPAPRRAVRTPEELSAVLSRLKTGDYVSFNVRSLLQGGGERVVNIRLGE